MFFLQTSRTLAHQKMAHTHSQTRVFCPSVPVLCFNQYSHTRTLTPTKNKFVSFKSEPTVRAGNYYYTEREVLASLECQLKVKLPKTQKQKKKKNTK